MRDYAVVPAKFWITPLAKSLRGNPSAQVVALYLKTGPHANMIGLYHCPVGYIAQDTGIALEGASKALVSLSEGGYCEYDADAEVVFVRDMAEEQIGESLVPTDKRVKAVIKQWQACSSDALKRAFHNRYSLAFALPPIEATSKSHQGPIDGSAKLLQGPIEGAAGIAGARVEGPSEPHRSQEQETDQEQDHSVPIGTGAAGAGQPPEAIPADRIELAAMLAVPVEGALSEDDEKLIWNGGLGVLLASYDSTLPAKAKDAKARMFIGGLGKRLKDAGADRRNLFDVIREACIERPVHPESWMSAAIAARLGKRAAPNRQEAQEQRNHAVAEHWAAEQLRKAGLHDQFSEFA